jgi:hypothetical protein
MSPISAGAETGRYIIRCRDDERPLAEFLAASGNDPAIKVVDTIGPAGKPHTVVAEMSGSMAQSLEQRFSSSNQLIIEPDRPLSLFQ